MYVSWKDLTQSAVYVSRRVSLTPGSTAEACMNDDKHRKNRYAKIIGTAGDT